MNEKAPRNKVLTKTKALKAIFTNKAIKLIVNNTEKIIIVPHPNLIYAI